jgi:hypothetical protein
MKFGSQAGSVKEQMENLVAKCGPDMEAVYQQYPELRPSSDDENKSASNSPQLKEEQSGKQE